MTNILKISADLKKYPLGIVRYASYALSGNLFVFIRKISASKAEISFSPKKGKMDAKMVSADFKKNLEDETLRDFIWEANKKLREFLILKAITAQERAPEPEKAEGLTPEQEKELEKLIAEVEEEIKKESSGAGGGGDPLKIKQTWEEKYGDESEK
ncbi:MAG: hypothetical protein COT17_07160 [Elusimicrobia bacterium CG08_land_8_20_14_0_20_51_18]|nr:MAG: hypothetical protein COT17_07160 [Elusimicrobia bacterium CG08_land_8_20_14_0_20_51_18]